MNELQLTVVEGFRCRGVDLDLSTADFWKFALDQRHFGPRRLMVVTAGSDGRMLGLAHCGQTDPPEMGLKCCLASLDDGAATAVAYSDEPVGLEPPADLDDRFRMARAAADEFGVYLVDWLMCDDLDLRSMRFTIEAPDDWWPSGGERLRRRPTRKRRRA
jgi:hypothetical protein